MFSSHRDNFHDVTILCHDSEIWRYDISLFGHVFPEKTLIADKSYRLVLSTADNNVGNGISLQQ